MIHFAGYKAVGESVDKPLEVGFYQTTLPLCAHALRVRGCHTCLPTHPPLIRSTTATTLWERWCCWK